MGMTVATEGLQFSLSGCGFFIAQYPDGGKLRESIYWLVKQSFQKGRTVFKDRNRDEIQKGPHNVLNFSLDCESVLIMYLFQKPNALGTVHLARFLSIDTNPPTPHPLCLSFFTIPPSPVPLFILY